MVALFVATLFIAFTVPGVVLALRALPWIAARVQAGVKPWVCDICMCFWTTALVAEAVSIGVGNWRFVICAGPAYTLALFFIGVLERPTTLPPPPE
jgi:hypothetical protein